jgi:hypothetical protein
MPKITPEAQAHDEAKARRNLVPMLPGRGPAAPVVVLRATFAISDHDLLRHVAGVLQQVAPMHGILDGSVSPGYGFGEWGREPCVTVECATPNVQGFHSLLRSMLGTYSQECAYVTVNGRDAYELSVNGDVSAITGRSA